MSNNPRFLFSSLYERVGVRVTENIYSAKYACRYCGQSKLSLVEMKHAHCVQKDWYDWGHKLCLGCFKDFQLKKQSLVETEAEWIAEKHTRQLDTSFLKHWQKQVRDIARYKGYKNPAIERMLEKRLANLPRSPMRILEK